MKVPKIIFFHAFGKKNSIFCVHLFSLKIRLQIILNKVSGIKKKNLKFDYENKVFQSLKNGIFLKGLTHAFGQKMQFLSFFWSK